MDSKENNPSGAPLSFREKLQMQLQRAKEIQKLAQKDLENSKNDTSSEPKVQVPSLPSIPVRSSTPGPIFQGRASSLLPFKSELTNSIAPIKPAESQTPTAKTDSKPDFLSRFEEMKRRREELKLQSSSSITSLSAVKNTTTAASVEPETKVSESTTDSTIRKSEADTSDKSFGVLATNDSNIEATPKRNFSDFSSRFRQISEQKPMNQFTPSSTTSSSMFSGSQFEFKRENNFRASFNRESSSSNYSFIKNTEPKSPLSQQSENTQIMSKQNDIPAPAVEEKSSTPIQQEPIVQVEDKPTSSMQQEEIASVQEQPTTSIQEEPITTVEEPIVPVQSQPQETFLNTPIQEKSDAVSESVTESVSLSVAAVAAPVATEMEVETEIPQLNESLEKPTEPVVETIEVEEQVSESTNEVEKVTTTIPEIVSSAIQEEVVTLPQVSEAEKAQEESEPIQVEEKQEQEQVVEISQSEPLQIEKEQQAQEIQQEQPEEDEHKQESSEEVPIQEQLAVENNQSDELEQQVQEITAPSAQVDTEQTDSPQEEVEEQTHIEQPIISKPEESTQEETLIQPVQEAIQTSSIEQSTEDTSNIIPPVIDEITQPETIQENQTIPQNESNEEEQLIEESPLNQSQDSIVDEVSQDGQQIETRDEEQSCHQLEESTSVAHVSEQLEINTPHQQQQLQQNNDEPTTTLSQNEVTPLLVEQISQETLVEQAIVEEEILEQPQEIEQPTQQIPNSSITQDEVPSNNEKIVENSAEEPEQDLLQEDAQDEEEEGQEEEDTENNQITEEEIAQEIAPAQIEEEEVVQIDENTESEEQHILSETIEEQEEQEQIQITQQIQEQPKQEQQLLVEAQSQEEQDQQEHELAATATLTLTLGSDYRQDSAPISLFSAFSNPQNMEYSPMEESQGKTKDEVTSSPQISNFTIEQNVQQHEVETTLPEEQLKPVEKEIEMTISQKESQQLEEQQQSTEPEVAKQIEEEEEELQDNNAEPIQVPEQSIPSVQKEHIDVEVPSQSASQQNIEEIEEELEEADQKAVDSNTLPIQSEQEPQLIIEQESQNNNISEETKPVLESEDEQVQKEQPIEESPVEEQISEVVAATELTQQVELPTPSIESEKSELQEAEQEVRCELQVNPIEETPEKISEEKEEINIVQSEDQEPEQTEVDSNDQQIEEQFEDEQQEQQTPSSIPETTIPQQSETTIQPVEQSSEISSSDPEVDLELVASESIQIKEQSSNNSNSKEVQLAQEEEEEVEQVDQEIQKEQEEELEEVNQEILQEVEEEVEQVNQEIQQEVEEEEVQQDIQQEQVEESLAAEIADPELIVQDELPIENEAQSEEQQEEQPVAASITQEIIIETVVVPQLQEEIKETESLPIVQEIKSFSPTSRSMPSSIEQIMNALRSSSALEPPKPEASSTTLPPATSNISSTRAMPSFFKESSAPVVSESSTTQATSAAPSIMNSRLLSMMDSFLAQKNSSSSSSTQQAQPAVIVSTEKKQQVNENSIQAQNESENQSFGFGGAFTPSNAKENAAAANNLEAQNQFSNDSFGITPKKIDFLDSAVAAAQPQTQQQTIQATTPFSATAKQTSSSSKNASPHQKQSIKKQQSDREFRVSRSPSKSPKAKQDVATNKNLRDASRSRSPIKIKSSVNSKLQPKPAAVSLKEDKEDDDSMISSVSHLSHFDLDHPTAEQAHANQQSAQSNKAKPALPDELSRISNILGIQKHNKNQMQVIESVYNENKNISKVMLNQSGKNILYQTLAMLDDSLPNHFIIVVTQSFLPLRTKMNKQVSWACINSLMGVEVLVQVQNLLMEKKIKLLFIQQEYLLQENLRFLKNQIKMIFFEDSTDKISDITQMYNIRRYHLFHTTCFRTKEQLDQVSSRHSLLNLDATVRLYGFDFTNMHWTFETEKEKSFINFIRKNNLKKVIMYIDRSKKIDEIVSSFNQKGLKMHAYNPAKIETTLNLFTKDSFEILCCYNGQVIPKLLKQLVQYYIHYHLPRNVLSYLSDMNGFQFYHMAKGGLPFDKFSCGFLTELDFFEIRSALIQDFTEKKLLNTLVRTLNGTLDDNSGAASGQNAKKKATSQITDDCFFNVVLDETEKKIQDHFINLMNDGDKFTDEDAVFSEGANVKHIQISKFSTEHCIKREMLLKMLGYLSAEKVQIMPFTAQLSVTQKPALIGNKMVNTIMKNNLNRTNVTFSVLECAQQLEMTSQELNKALKKLSAEKKIQYDVKEEVAVVALKSNIESNLDSLFEQIRFQELKQISELDTMYLAAKLTCNMTLEQVFKYQKYKETSNKSQSSEETSASTALNLKNILENYLNSVQATQELSVFSGNDKQKLPFITLKSQREKSNLIKDILSLLPKITKSKLPDFTLNRDISLMDFDAMSRFVSLILQGIDAKNINEFKPALQFKKYFRFDYFDVNQIANEFLQSHYLQLLQSETTKKIKI